MSLETQVTSIIRGKVSGGRPQRGIEGDVDVPRLTSLKDLSVSSVASPKNYAVADDGNYFTCSTADQTGKIGSAAVGYVATTPCMIVANTDTVANPDKKSIHLDYLTLTVNVVGSAASGLASLRCALILETGNHYTSGGTDYSANCVNTNMAYAKASSITKVYFGDILAVTTDADARVVVPMRIVRNAISASVMNILGDVYTFTFGGSGEVGYASEVIAVPATIPVPMPPVVIAPGTCAMFYLWQLVGATNVATTYVPELGFYER